MKVMGVALALSLSGVACSGGSALPDDSAPGTPLLPRPSPTAQRGITDPKGVIVENVSLEETTQDVERAIGDLKEVGLWRRLTSHLYGVKFGSRNGRSNIPDDGHLADAFLTAKIDGNIGGTYCDIVFFPTAMEDDLDRWRSYYSQGLLSDEAPTFRQFWASIMAHELSHCFDGPHGEPVALRWEAKALAAVREAGL
jgi:hypothetical protein